MKSWPSMATYMEELARAYGVMGEIKKAKGEATGATIRFLWMRIQRSLLLNHLEPVIVHRLRDVFFVFPPEKKKTKIFFFFDVM
jgi:hypothetical protein